MVALRFQHSWQGVSGTAEDRYVNTFYAEGPALPDESGLLTAAFAIMDFYDAVHSPSTENLHYWLSTDIDSPGRTVKIYNMADPEPRAPIYVLETDPTISYTGSNLPSEVALCLSYAAPAISGTNPARRRGRVYVGPLNIRAVGTSGADVSCRPDGALQSALVNAGQGLHDDLLAVDGLIWSMYSPTSNDFLIISRVWCDNAFDTQRRRGLDPTSRVSLAIT